MATPARATPPDTSSTPGASASPGASAAPGSSTEASPFLRRLADPRPLLALEMRPPRSTLSAAESLEAWIDANHAVRRLTATDTIVFITDNAVGSREEENLQHLLANLGPDADPGKLVPFLTCKHALDYCTWYAQRAAQGGYRALVVLGGDRHDGIPRCVPHAAELRRLLRSKVPGLTLGGWANPGRDPVEQVGWLADGAFEGQFFLTQIVSHFRLAPVERFLSEAARRGVGLPGVFGVFYYRSGNPKTLERLSQFIPVPVAEVQAAFAAGASPDELAAATLRALAGIGVRSFYVSNLPTLEAPRILARLARLAFQETA